MSDSKDKIVTISYESGAQSALVDALKTSTDKTRQGANTALLGAVLRPIASNWLAGHGTYKTLICELIANGESPLQTAIVAVANGKKGVSRALKKALSFISGLEKSNSQSAHDAQIDELDLFLVSLFIVAPKKPTEKSDKLTPSEKLEMAEAYIFELEMQIAALKALQSVTA